MGDRLARCVANPGAIGLSMPPANRAALQPRWCLVPAWLDLEAMRRPPWGKRQWALSPEKLQALKSVERGKAPTAVGFKTSSPGRPTASWPLITIFLVIGHPHQSAQAPFQSRPLKSGNYWPEVQRRRPGLRLSDPFKGHPIAIPTRVLTATKAGLAKNRQPTTQQTTHTDQQKQPGRKTHHRSQGDPQPNHHPRATTGPGTPGRQGKAGRSDYCGRGRWGQVGGLRHGLRRRTWLCSSPGAGRGLHARDWWNGPAAAARICRSSRLRHPAIAHFIDAAQAGQDFVVVGHHNHAGADLGRQACKQVHDR